jgi:hypothetical protein
MTRLPPAARPLPTASHPRERRSSARVAGLFLVLALTACGSQEAKVATSMNAYDFYEARAEECVVAEGWCSTVAAHLKAWKRHLIEANRAVKMGGKCPLQLKQIKLDEKAVARGY